MLKNVFIIKEAKWSKSALTRFLSDPEMQQIDLFISPPIIPHAEDWDLYESMIEPVIRAAGWVPVHPPGRPTGFEFGDSYWTHPNKNPDVQMTPELINRIRSINSKSSGAYAIAPANIDLSSDDLFGKYLGTENITASFIPTMTRAVKKHRGMN